MQGLHHQQQQLAALLSAALPKENDPSTSSSSSTMTGAVASSSSSSSSSSVNNSTSSSIAAGDDEASRVAAITSLHRAIVYPHNSILVAHSASFLAQGFSQLLSDKSYLVRQSAALAYGALSSVLCSVPMASNGRQNHVLLGGLVDRFMGWALPLLTNIGNGTADLALESLHEFLNVGDVGAIERYALPILKSCQELLEDERTSLILVRRLLGVLTLISLKFFRCFQPHFVDIVDLLLGWAMVPDLAESDLRVIMDSFLQFQKHWVNNMQFSLGLLSKFLGDMDVLLQDGGPGTPQQFQRLLALLSCFSTVLQSVASGLLEISLLEQISEPLCKMVPILLGCLSLIGKKFGWSKWIEDSWRCLTLLAEILGDRFSIFYPAAADILFQCLEFGDTAQHMRTKKITSFQVHGVLKTNLQLLSLQKLGLLSSSVQKILQLDGHISRLRLHPNHLVAGSAAATYIFLLQHINNEVVQKTIILLFEELKLFKSVLEKTRVKGNDVNKSIAPNSFSPSELFALTNFDLKVLLSSVSLGGGRNGIGQVEIDTLFLSRSDKLVSFIIQEFDPLSSPIKDSIDLQVTVLKTLGRLTAIEFLSKCSVSKQIGEIALVGTSVQRLPKEENSRNALPMVVMEYLRKYSALLVNVLHSVSALAVKLEALEWLHRFCENVIKAYENANVTYYPCEVFGYFEKMRDLLFSILNAASDREPKVRSLVAALLNMLLQAKLVHPTQFSCIAEVVLEKLGDPEDDIRNAFIRFLSHVLPITMYVSGLYDYDIVTTRRSGVLRLDMNSKMHWKQVFLLKQLPQQLRSQQLVSILSYISQRWKVPLSTWIQRIICTCRSSKERASTQLEEAGYFDANSLLWDIKIDEDALERVCSVNNIAGAWWAINEAARYCISTRLRTNLGGPSQTFAALERMLLDIAHVLQLDTDQNDGNLNIISSSYAHLLPMRLLLDFVESLKKNVYNAYEGSIVLPCANRQSSLFFRANKKVCEEWFSRICEPMMNSGLALQCHDATIHYCGLRLVELNSFVSSALKDKSRGQVSENLQNMRGRFTGDILRVARHMALALCRNHLPEALIGLQKWASMAFAPLFQEENQFFTVGEILRQFSWITGLVYQGQGQHEKAAAHFIHLLQTEDSLSSMGSEGVQFIIARIIESYTAVSDWKSLESWLLELQTLRARHAGKNYSGALTTAGNEINSVQALACFDEGDFQASWACLDLTPKSSSELTLDPKLALQRSEQMLLQAMLFHRDGKLGKVSHELQKAQSMLEEILSILPLDGLVDAAPYVNHLHCILAFESSCNPGGSQDKHYQPLLGSYIQDQQTPISYACQDCSLWLKVFRICRTTQPTSPITLKLGKDLLNLARKQRNLLLANRLNNYLSDRATNCLDKNFHDHLISTLQYESILLMHAEDRIEDALTNLWLLLRPVMLSSQLIVSNSYDDVLRAKACLKFSNWLQGNYSGFKVADTVLKMLADLNTTQASPPGRMFPNLNAIPNVSAVVEGLVGAATKLSTQLCPTMAKSWISYGSWCYSQGRMSLSANNESVLSSCSYLPSLASEVLPKDLRLTEEEQLKVKSVILQLFQRKSCDVAKENNEEFDVSFEYKQQGNLLKSLFDQIVEIIESAAEVAGAEDHSEGLSAILTSKLKNCLVCASVTLEDSTVSSCLDDLVNLCRSLRRRRVALFGHAAEAFINYLSYSSSQCSDGQLTGLNGGSKYKSVSYTLRATLYVLNILLNYGADLRDTLEPALSTVPLLPWQEIIPQLFARLSSHPEQVVRQQLESLLVLLAKLAPWSVVYPTLVDANTHEKEPSGELQQILACLNKLYPSLVQDAQLMIKELENVTVLWEELWLSTLQDLHADVVRRINLLKEEATRIAENITLSHGEKSKINAAKYSAMMAPIVVVLERRLASTSRKPETPHEMWFYEEFGDQIRSAILKFKTPPASLAALAEVWRPFENIATSLSSYQKKSTVSLGEVAPQLAQMSSSEAPMPGLEKHMTSFDPNRSLSTANDGIVTIASFSEDVAILSTKTKPKKLIIVGSDGQKYTYLLKGREDLRLDARIMQLLQAVNGFLSSSSATRNKPLGIRYYSVTPISDRAGLIQWVDNVISIYSVFKSWQTRVQQAQLSGLNSGNTKNTVPPPVPRPVDMFYGKIIPALKEKGIRRVISRRDWPHEVKRKVLLDLMKEAPKQLLYQELWCASEGFRAFNSKIKRYSGSVAAMSIVGHMLGLGDRHLDNILIDFCSGDILHIDYNVCFDKGQRLKVPEIVPFRLTHTIEAALGLTGIEGAFRTNCEAVLSVLKKNKDIILMLLEAFVWDPLVEWTRGDFHDDAAIVGEERKGMELAVSLSLFASRVQEIRVPLQEHHDLLLTTLPAVESALERFVSILNQYEIVSVLFHRIDQERSNLVLHETSAKSLVAEATSTSEKIRASLEIQAREFAQAQTFVMEKAQEATNWIEHHGRILDALRSSLIPESNAWTRLTGAEESLSLSSAVQVAGVPLTVVPEPTQAQCSDIDREVSLTVAELDHGLSSLVTSLQTYSLALQRILPLNYLTTSPVHTWAQVLQLSVNTLSSDVLSLARKQAAEIISKFHADRHCSYQSSYDELCVNVGRYAAQIEKMEEEYEELVNSIGPESESSAKDRLLSAFLNYMQSCGLLRREDAVALELLKVEVPGDARLQGESEVKGDFLRVLSLAAISLYGDVKRRVLSIQNDSSGANLGNNMSQSELGPIFGEFEEQIEKCLLVAGFLNELKKYVDGGIPLTNVDNASINFAFQDNWASVFQTSLLSCKSFVQQMIEVVLPEVVRCVISFNSEMMDVFGSLSQIKGSIDTALEQLFQVELERASLIELEQNYFLKVGLITEQQLALEEASVKGRDHLSWEEAEELASQEEGCRAQLDKLHQTWNQKDMRTTSLNQKEANVVSAMFSSKNLLQSLTSTEQDREPHFSKSRVLLTTLMHPFSELESADQALASFDRPVAPGSVGISQIVDLVNSGCPLTDFIWKFPAIPHGHAFFMWKVSLVDYFLDSCSHNIASFVDQNLGFDQLVNVVKEKLEVRLQDYIGQYLRERVAPALLTRLDKESESLKHVTELRNNLPFDPMKIDPGTTKKVQDMLEEYCNAHETVRAARSAASMMKRQINDSKEALLKTALEIVQMEWMHDITLSLLQNNRLLSLKFLANDDYLLPVILNISRAKLLESIRSSIGQIARSLESLQACEKTSVSAEGQLERAMIWACGGPSSSTMGNNLARNAGIPPKFHDHLTRRRTLLWETREKASEIMKICIAILEFEASRDGIFHNPEVLYPSRTGADGRGWQQVYVNILTRLDVSYHSFTRTEQEWRLAQSNMEAASSGLYSASNELSVASVKVKSASDDLQSTLLAMRDCAYEASVALSAFAGISKGHTALTSECGSMLEEVLAITEDLHDVHSLGKEASDLHFSLTENLSKVNVILLPLESILSKDVAAMTDAMVKEQETKMEISPIHGQAIFRSYSIRTKEACEALRPLLTPLTSSVKGLYSMLTRLARTASLHAGNLHKALEGLGESQEERSQNNLSRSDIAGDDIVYDSGESEMFAKSEAENDEHLFGMAGLSLEDKGWISPPTSISSGSSVSDVVSADASFADSSNSSDLTDSILHVSTSTEVKEFPEQFSSSGIDLQEKLSASQSGSVSVQGILKNEAFFSNQDKGVDGPRDSSFINSEATTRATRGKNTYAMSILRRVEMKLDGRDITDKREISISEQVDFLLKQATSTDNLCNMYEGWTPWI